MNIYYQRQNDKEGLRLLKAYKNCSNKELILTYVCIIFSLIFSLLGIILSVIQMVYKNDPVFQTDIAKNLATSQDVVSVVSGFYLVLQIFLLYFAEESGKNKVTIMEMFDNYVYGLKPNQMIMRPISEAQIDEWADKIRKKDDYFKNQYYKEDSKDNDIFDNQVEISSRIFGVLNYAFSRFFIFIWGLVIAMVLAFTIIIGIDANFLEVVLRIFVPSLSIITMIANSFKKYFIQKKAAISCLNSIRSIKQRGTKVNENDIRNLQDAIFQQRLSLMNIPNFVTHSYEKRYYKRKLKYGEAKLIKDSKPKQKPVKKEPAPIKQEEKKTNVLKPQEKQKPTTQKQQPKVSSQKNTTKK